MRIDDKMRRLLEDNRLCFAATVCPDGTPNVSPKGTTMVWDDEHIAFLHLYSPGTVANLIENPAIEINVVDPLLRKGYRFKGQAAVLTEGAQHAAVIDRYERERGIAPERAHAVVLIRVDHVAPLSSPGYDDGTTEAQMVARYRDHFAELAERHLTR